MKTSCSLVISTYNWPQALYLCLQSVFRQKYLPNEIVIADDGSTEETKILINKLSAQSPVPIIHIWHKDNGFRLAEIRNKAIKATNYDYIIQIDGDIILHRDFINDHIKNAKSGFFISGNRVLLSQDLTNEIMKTSKIRFSFFTKGLLKKHYALRLPFIDKILKVKPNHISTIIGCNLSFWRNDFMSVNGYNNAMWDWGHEDIELVARLIKYGIKCKKLRFSANCYHIYHPGNSSDNECNNYMIYKNTINSPNHRCDNGVEQI